MKTLQIGLAVLCFLIATIISTVAQAQYVQVCENGVCRLIPAQQRIVNTAYTQRTIALVADDVVLPRVADTPFKFASLQTEISAPLAVNAAAPAVNLVTAGSNCGCAVNGVCSCLGVCNCVNCSCAMQRQQQALQMATANSYYSVAAPATIMYSSPMFASEKILQTPTGHVHVYQDSFGNVATAHSGGHIQRKVARQERWRARHGVQ